MKLLQSKVFTYTVLASIVSVAALLSGSQFENRTVALPTNPLANAFVSKAMPRAGSNPPGFRTDLTGDLDIPPEENWTESNWAEGNWGLAIEQYAIQHQGPHILGIKINCTPKLQRSDQDFSEASRLYSEIDQFLINYPNNMDYWEIVNRKLTSAILQAHPSLASVTVSLKVLPNQREPYTRSTTVTRTSDGKILESWSFLTAQVIVPQDGGHKLNITTQYLYRNGITNSEYPDFIPICHRIAQFLQSYPSDTASWEKVNRDLVTMVLREYPMMKSFTSRLEVMPTKSDPYRYFTTLTLNK
jgi:hypothetical protein